ncbi:MAG: hypothetical protein COA78_35380 [Blastopirellula sp.]|nr:MAG: hypothetical protein COA78_35380 [Blastopirellula sp.]
MGSFTGGTSVDGGDVNGFKILVFDEADGAVALHAAPSANPAYPGSPMYKQGVIAAQNRVAQQQNLALWLVKDGISPWLWVIPDDVKVTTEHGITFLECDRTWVAIRPLGVSTLKVDSALTQNLSENENSRFPGHKVLSAKGEGDIFCGLAVEVGEKESHGSFAAFKKAAKSAEVDVSELDKGIARYKAAGGNHLGIHWNNEPMELGVWRNGKRRDLKADAGSLYRGPVINSAWGSGILEVNADGETFRCEVDADGKISFK